MAEALRRLIEIAGRVTMTEDQRERQRRSFAYGSAKIENEDITPEMVDEAASRLSEARMTKS